MSELIYNNTFYKNRHNETAKSAAAILAVILDLLKIDSAVDIGCGVGAWLKALREKGVCDIAGIDGSWVPLEHIVIPGKFFLCKNLSEPLNLNREFSLAICLEVAEHLSPDAGERLVRELTNLAPYILFSAAIPGQTGDGHVNEQWPEYWIAKFKDNGYSFIDCIRPAVWGNKDVLWWYSQNTFLFAKKDAECNFPVKPDSPVFPLKCVHPKCFNMISGKAAAFVNIGNFNFQNRKAYIRKLIQLVSERDYILWGAGKHTQWLLKLCDEFNLKKPLFIIDDYSALKEIAGVKVFKPESRFLNVGRWILLSSDCPDIARSMRASSESVGFEKDKIIDIYDGFCEGPYISI